MALLAQSMIDNGLYENGLAINETCIMHNFLWPIRQLRGIIEHMENDAEDDLPAPPVNVPRKAPPWRPGQSGNPKGKARGSRNKACLIAEVLLDGETQRLTRRAIDLALEGDTVALRLCLERILPPVRERPCSFKLPKLET